MISNRSLIPMENRWVKVGDSTRVNPQAVGKPPGIKLRCDLPPLDCGSLLPLFRSQPAGFARVAAGSGTKAAAGCRSPRSILALQ